MNKDYMITLCFVTLWVGSIFMILTNYWNPNEPVIDTIQIGFNVIVGIIGLFVCYHYENDVEERGSE